MKELSACPVCRSAEIKLIYTARSTQRQDDCRWSVWECRACTHQFINPQPSWQELEPYYSSSYNSYKPQHGSVLSDEQEIELAKQRGSFRHIPLPENKRVLDVGCGGGRFLRICKKLGAIELGVEPSKFGAQSARGQGLNIFEGTLESYVEQAPVGTEFDVITASHVVEHLPDPVETLRAMRQVLAPDGFIWIAVPNAAYPISRALKGNYYSTDLPRHLMQFTPASMLEAGRQAGLKLRFQATESLPWVVSNSLTQYLRFKLKIPRAISQRFPALNMISQYYARHLDSIIKGEAVLTEFVPSKADV
jgi:2-polyprenyl-3-methyl-5-hydroxy-6-metoxy-1,4-benzoquinol methylase